LFTASFFSQDPITSESSYLKRQISDSNDVAVDLPAGLTVDAFADAVASCYGADVELSPGNLAATWAAADWLELSAEDGLARRAEDYFFQEVATDHGRAAAVLRSCTTFLVGEVAGAGAALIVRCLETLAASGGADSGWLEDVAALPLEEFQVVVEAMRARLTHDHDLMYTIVDHYLEVKVAAYACIRFTCSVFLLDMEDTGSSKDFSFALALS
jgi:hypothetical protein